MGLCELYKYFIENTISRNQGTCFQTYLRLSWYQLGYIFPIQAISGFLAFVSRKAKNQTPHTPTLDCTSKLHLSVENRAVKNQASLNVKPRNKLHDPKGQCLQREFVDSLGTLQMGHCLNS